MQSVRSSILQCLHNFSSDEENLVKELNRLIEQKGPKVCQSLFQILASLDLKPKKALLCWQEIIAHWEKLNAVLLREVSIRTAICDYFCTIYKSLENPKVVEVQVFEETLKESIFDSLTGLYNRQYFNDTLSREIETARRYQGELTILFLDIDNFKNINDSFGHRAGDAVLKRISEIILKGKRAGDIAARFGGEELVVIMPRTDRQNARVLGERIRSKFEDTTIEFEKHSIRATISGGLASFPADANDSATLLEIADRALYQAKGAGKNKILSFARDKRRYLRIDCKRKIKVRELGFNGSPNITAMSKNIGMGGILFENSFPMEVGTKIQASVPIQDDTPLLIIGTVVRKKQLESDRYDIGASIAFREMDKLTRSEISKYLTNQSTA